MPRDGACQDLQYNAIEMLYTRRYMLNWLKKRQHYPAGSAGSAGRSAIDLVGSAGSDGNVDIDNAANMETSDNSSLLLKRIQRIVIIQRTPHIKTTVPRGNVNSSDGGSSDIISKNKDSLRTWTNDFVQSLIKALSTSSDMNSATTGVTGEKHQQPRDPYFPPSLYDIEVYSDNNITLNNCIACQIALFAQADIVIGVHGAGLANSIYMPSAILDDLNSSDAHAHDSPGGSTSATVGDITSVTSRGGGMVVEVIPAFDSRHAPGIGIFPRVSALLGLHHFSYYSGHGGIGRNDNYARSRREILENPFNVSDFANNVYTFWKQTRP